MKRECPHCTDSSQGKTKYGSFVRRSDGRRLKRYRCRNCKGTFSEATFQLCYRQKKRRLNPRARELLVSGVSQRRAAVLLRVSRLTVVRKFRFLAANARIENQKDFEAIESLEDFQFDELETFEHTKCKPLSVIVAVDRKTRLVLGYRVASMPAKGPLAALARKKYGYRPDNRRKARQELFQSLAPKVAPGALIQSDQNPHYPKDVKKWFPEAIHKTCKGKRGCVTGQGELKKVGFDPLFALNHTLAMFRANMNRLFRKTWCTTKTPQGLIDHIDLYIQHHNRVLVKKH